MGHFENWLILAKMRFNDSDRILIKLLRLETGYGSKKFLKEFPGKKWSRSGLDKLLAKIDATGSADRKNGSGRPRSSSTQQNVAIVNEMAMSQEDAPGTHRSVRQIAQETSIAKSTVHKIIHRDLNLQCFKKKRAQELTEANKQTRLVRAKQLLKKYPERLVNFIWFTDEKLFTVAPAVNLQNDRL